MDATRAETDLAAGELACPGCGATLRRWGHARPRRVRDHTVTTLTLRPRRTRCPACGATHVLLPGALLPRRADTTAVIGTALLASARGIGYRRIAADLGRAPSTVRRWVRSVRGAHTEWLRAQALDWIDRVDREVVATLTATRTRLGDALSAVTAAALAVQTRFTPHVPIWTVIARITNWRLLPPTSG
ncbi:MAG: DUF6431 domain-containing protein [Pseudonocardiaceae bacterium]